MTHSATAIAAMRRAFRQLHTAGCFVVPNPWDPGSARYLEGLGFKALATTSAGAAWSLGCSDGELSRAMVLAHLQKIVGATDLPVSADFGDGFAADTQGVGESVSHAIATGVAGVSIGDSSGNPTYPLREIDAAAARIAAARRAIDAAGGDAFLIGCTDGHIAGRPNLDDTIARLRAYSRAGADSLCAPGINTRDQIAAVVAAVAPKPVTLLVESTTELTLRDIAALGVRHVSVGAGLARSAWSGFMHAADSIAREGRFDGLRNSAPSAALDSIFRSAGDLPIRRTAKIVGKVEYRQGEGALLEIPLGSVLIETTSADATFSWTDGRFHDAAAMPLDDFCSYLSEGSITFDR